MTMRQSSWAVVARVGIVVAALLVLGLAVHVIVTLLKIRPGVWSETFVASQEATTSPPPVADVTGDLAATEDPPPPPLETETATETEPAPTVPQVLATVEGPDYTAEVVHSGDARLGRCVKMDGVVQWCEHDEHHRHETLVHAAATYLLGEGLPRRVLIVGGADCGALREALKYPTVERVVVIDGDEHLRMLCEDHMDIDAHRGDTRVTWVNLPPGEGVKRQPAATYDIIVLDYKERPGSHQTIGSPTFLSELRLRLTHEGILVVASSAYKPLLEDLFTFTLVVSFPSHASGQVERAVLCSDTINLAKHKPSFALIKKHGIFTRFYKPTAAVTALGAASSAAVAGISASVSGAFAKA
jgi:spermidine synthase